MENVSHVVIHFIASLAVIIDFLRRNENLDTKKAALACGFLCSYNEKAQKTFSKKT